MSSLAGLSVLDKGPDSAPRPPTSSLPPGLADHPVYEVIRELGQGGMGTVYLAENRLMGRKEVLKVVSSHMMNRRGVLDRFLVEIRNAARLHHTNIVTAYSAMPIGESIVFAMEFVDGLDLARLVKARGPLPIANVCNYGHQAALGLQYATELGMVHRDIKPSNLMLAKRGNRANIKVLDFGLAKVRSEGAVDRGLTHEGQMLGTPDYIAPEQINDARGADIRADVYSLGCTLYYLLIGAPPFEASSLYEVLQAHHSMDALPLNLRRPEVPVELAALVARMMAKDPEHRFQTPRDVAQALSPFFKNGSLVLKRTAPEVSQLGQSLGKQCASGADSVPTQRMTGLPAFTAQECRKSPESDTSPPHESSIELNEPHSVKESAAAVTEPRSYRANSLWPTAVAMALLMSFAVSWLPSVFRVRTPEGDLVFDGLPKDAVVTVDGKVCTVEWPDDQSPARITVPSGGHKVKVELKGLEIHGEDVKIVAGDQKWMRVRLEPTAVVRPISNGAAPSSVPEILSNSPQETRAAARSQRGTTTRNC